MDRETGRAVGGKCHEDMVKTFYGGPLANRLLLQLAESTIRYCPLMLDCTNRRPASPGHTICTLNPDLFLAKPLILPHIYLNCDMELTLQASLPTDESRARRTLPLLPVSRGR